MTLVAVLYWAYDAVRGLIRGDAAIAIRHGHQILRLEHLLGIDVERPLNSLVQHWAVLAVPVCFFYASAHFLVTPAALIWTYRAHPARYAAAGTVLAILTVTALLGFWLLPTAPPRLLPGSGFHDTLRAYSGWGWWSATDSAPRALASLANQFAAFPSLHVAWAARVGATLWRHGRLPVFRAAGMAYPLITVLVVLGTANHYVLDVLAGIGLWFVVDRTVGSMPHRRLIERRVGPNDGRLPVR